MHGNFLNKTVLMNKIMDNLRLAHEYGKGSVEDILEEVSLYLCNCKHAPMRLKLERCKESIIYRVGTYVGGFLPGLKMKDEYRYFCGMYNEENKLNVGSWIIKNLLEKTEVAVTFYKDCIFDFVKSKRVNELVCIPVQGQASILPLAGNEENQKLRFFCHDKIYEATLGQYEYSFFSH